MLILLLGLDVKVIRIILIVELGSIYHALDVGAAAILLRASIGFGRSGLGLGTLPPWREVGVGGVVHHLHPIVSINLF